MQNIHKLFTNHMDAWGLTLMIASTCLLLHEAVSWRGVMLAVAVAMVYWLGFALNDYFDAPYDALDPQKAHRSYFVTSTLPDIVIKVAFCLMALALSAFFLQFGTRGLLVTVIGAFIAWAYSAPPLRLKTRPLLDLTTHMVFVETFPYFLMLYLLELTWIPLDGVLLAFFILASLSAQLEQQARDYETDRKAERNFTTVYGLKITTALLRLFTGLLITAAVFVVASGVIPLMFVPFGVIVLPFLLHRFFRKATEARSEKLARLTVIFGLIYAAAVWGGVLLV